MANISTYNHSSVSKYMPPTTTKRSEVQHYCRYMRRRQWRRRRWRRRRSRRRRPRRRRRSTIPGPDRLSKMTPRRSAAPLQDDSKTTPTGNTLCISSRTLISYIRSPRRGEHPRLPLGSPPNTAHKQYRPLRPQPKARASRTAQAASTRVFSPKVTAGFHH